MTRKCFSLFVLLHFVILFFMIACIFVDLLFFFGKLVFSYNGQCIRQWRPGGQNLLKLNLAHQRL